MSQETQIITRRITIYIDESDPEKKKEYQKTLYSWHKLVKQGANELLSYLYAKDRLKYYKFITEDTKKDFGIIGAKGSPVKEISGGYVLLSERMKGQIPMNILSCLNQDVLKNYKAKYKDVMSGKCSLRTYRNNIPVPFVKQIFESLTPVEIIKEDGKRIKSYKFCLYGIPFALFFGKDKSNNRIIIEKCLNKEYQFCNSSITIDNDISLHLSIKIPVKKLALDEKNELICSLDIQNPIIAEFAEKSYSIGSKEDFLYKRMAIQGALRRAQKNAKENRGGKGRKRKLQSLDRFKEKEYNFVKTKLHCYSRDLINLACKLNCGTITLLNPDKATKKEIKEERLEGNDFIFRNWSYYGLSQFIKYKANILGIKINLSSE